MKRFAILLFFLFATAAPAFSQNASPLGGVGSLQLFANDGTLLTSGAIYIYLAGTSTQATVYIDSTGTTTQPNPVTFGSGARASIWLANGQFFKVVLCQQNDGSSCAPGDVIFSADQIPIGSSSGSGNTGTFTGIFISSTASPATSGVLRLASGDSICFRNAAGSTNLCIKKDSNDLFSLDSGSWKLPEVGAPAGVPGSDILWADNTAHRLKAVNNAGTAAQYVLSGNDIGTTDNVTALHFGATQETLSSTAPTTGQNLQWNGSAIVGVTPPIPESLIAFDGNNAGLGGVAELPATKKLIVNAHTLIRFTASLAGQAAGCTTSPVIALWDATSAAAITSLTISNSTSFFDSGALSIALTAGHQFDIKVTTAWVGCTTAPNLADVTANIQ